MPVSVSMYALLEQCDEGRPFRAGANETHIAAEDVDQLRDLIQRGPPQVRPKPRPTIVAFYATGADVLGGTRNLGFQGFERRGFHRTELEHHELVAVPSD